MNMMENETWITHKKGGGNNGYNLDGKMRRLSAGNHLSNILHVWCFTVFNKAKN
jgi:hypothetical protein